MTLTLRVGQSVIAIGNPLESRSNSYSRRHQRSKPRPFGGSENNRYLEGMNSNRCSHQSRQFWWSLAEAKRGGSLASTRPSSRPKGIGFAIPIATATVADQIIEHGRPLRLGILGGSLTPALASIREQAGLELAVERGAFIRGFSPIPSGRVGLAQGDVITAVNGEKLPGCGSSGPFSERDSAVSWVLLPGRDQRR